MRKVRKINKHPIHPDIKYNSLKISSLINKIMLDGKKDIAREIIYKALEKIENKISGLPKSQENSELITPLIVFEKALDNLKLELELKSQKRGGANLRIPHKVTERRGFIISLQILIKATRKRRKKEAKPISEVLAEEIWGACHETGDSFKEKKDINKMVLANLAFAHNIRKKNN